MMNMKDFSKYVFNSDMRGCLKYWNRYGSRIFITAHTMHVIAYNMILEGEY